MVLLMSFIRRWQNWLVALFLILAVCVGIRLIPHAHLSKGFLLSNALYDENNELLRLTLANDERYRLWTPLSDISPMVVQGVQLYEDQWFYYHAGFNPFSLIRGGWKSYTGASKQGGSTLTMQLARMYWRLNTKTIRGKAIQILRAIELELCYSKDDILEAYLNYAPYGRNIESIGAASLTRLKKVLAKDSILRDNKLQELVILKGIHDGFYEDNFSRKNLLILLDSLYFSSIIPEHKYIAANIRDKVVQLLPGYFPPMLKLYDVEGKAISLDQFKGKFIYLNFCSINSYTCLQDFSLLQKIHEKYGNKVEIISISTDPDLEDLKYFVKTKPYKWKFVHYGSNPDIITRYDVRAYPTYFLINPEGKMEVSPAPSPREKLEMLLINQLKSKDML